MRYLIEPLLRFISHVEEVTENQRYQEPLRVSTRDEIAILAGAFNRLMAEVAGQKKSAREQVAFLQTLIDTIPNPIYYKNLQGHYLGCNQAFEKLVSRDRDQVVGKTLRDMAPAAMAIAHGAADAELYRQPAGHVQNFESSLSFQGELARDVLFYKAVFNDDAGQPAGLVGSIVDITQRKAIEYALAEEREFSVNLLQNSAVPCFVIDTNHQILAWTLACEELTGVPAAEMLGSDRHWQGFYPDKRPCLADLIIDGDLEQAVDLYDYYANSPFVPEGLRAEGWFPAVGGKPRYLLFEAAPIRDSRGNLVAAIETFHDLTSLKQAEQALLESEQSARALIERSPDAIVVHREGKIVFINPAAARLFAADSSGRMTGTLVAERVHPDFLESMQQRVRRVEELQENQGYLEQKILRLDGTMLDIEAASTPVFYRGQWAVQTILRDITARKELQEKIWHQANYDSLTGIPNRMMFLDRLQYALAMAERQQQNVALLFIDLDNFKEVNDTQGHAVGDILLQQVAQRLLRVLRKNATLARMGGDEFTVIIPLIADPEAMVKAILERLLRKLAEPFLLPEGHAQVSASIGIAYYPKDGSDAATLMKNADIAMYRAKEGGGNRYTFYTPMDGL